VVWCPSFQSIKGKACGSMEASPWLFVALTHPSKKTGLFAHFLYRKSPTLYGKACFYVTKNRALQGHECKGMVRLGCARFFFQLKSDVLKGSDERKKNDGCKEKKMITFEIAINKKNGLFEMVI